MSVTHDELETDLAQAHVGVGASDLHGSMTGYLCGGGRADAAHVMEALELDLEHGPARQRVDDDLKDLYLECRAALADVELGFQPLLPAVERPLPERAVAVVEWCRGFLGGFGLARTRCDQALSADADEILRDFGTIAGSELTCGNDEDDERALMEVCEFVRVGALLLHTEMAVHGATPAPADPRVH